MDLVNVNDSFIEASQQSSGAPVAANTNNVILRSSVSEIDLSQDLLQQAFQEVTPAAPEVLQVKEEVPELLDRVDLLTTPPLTVNNPSTSNCETSASSAVVDPQNFENKVKVEELPLNILQGINTNTTTSNDSVIFVPTVQIDGGVAYTVQPRHGLTRPQQQSIDIHSAVIQSGPSLVAPSVNVIKPTTNQCQVISQSAAHKIKPKTILPKSLNLTQIKSNIVYQSSILENNKSPVKILPTLPSIIRKPSQGMSVRRIQLITGNNGQHRNIEIITKDGETSIKSDQQLSSLEVKHVQSIIQHQKDFKGCEGEKQVYQVVYPSNVQQPSHPPVTGGENIVEDRSIKESSINVSALVSQMKRKGNGKTKCRGRPRKGTPKIINKKKVYKELKKELGIREVRVKEFGLMEREEDFENSSAEMSGDFVKTTSKSRTRSGRLSRPPNRIQAITEEAEEETRMSEGEVSAAGAVTNMSNRPPPKVDYNIPHIPLPNRRNFVPPEKYICKVCGKLYLGDRKIAKHLKHFPSHEFATPDLPRNIVKEVRKTSHLPTNKPVDSIISDSEPNSFLDQVGPALFKSFSLWDLLVKKTIIKKLGTKESLTSLFADMQAIVMELKNLVEQCLSCERTDDDSHSVSLTPIMSSVLGLSQSGGVTRFVLPSTMIPQHYHQLLNLQSCDKILNDVSSSTDQSLMSPESTNYNLPPDEENSQMSLSSDIIDQPLGDKVVLEDNLGARPVDIDEETQDSSIVAPSPDISIKRKRARLGSESHSAISPPPRTPDFLSQGDDSNLSSISVVTVSEPSREVRDNDVSVVTPAKRICHNMDTDCNTKLPSFSSLVNGSPKADSLEPSEAPVSQQNQSCEHHTGHSSNNNSSSVFETTTEQSVAVTTSFGISTGNTSSSNPLLKLQETFGISNRDVTLAGSAPVSPRVSYTSSNASQNFARRCSLDNITRTAPENILLGLESKVPESSSPLLDILAPSVTDNNPLSSISVTSFTLDQRAQAAASNNSAASTFPQFRRSEDSLVSTPFEARVTEWQQPQAENSIKRTANETNIHGDLDQNVKTGILKPSPVEPFSQKAPTHFSSGSSTHVTFSDELSHPIPSVSPAKDFREIDLKRQNPTPPSESQSSSIFSDLESVLNEASDFAFHNELSSVDRSRVKTPEKQLLVSVPPQVIIEEKPSASISFDNILDFNKVNAKEKCAVQTVQSDNVESASLPNLPGNIPENPPNFTFPNSNSIGNDSNNS